MSVLHVTLLDCSFLTHHLQLAPSHNATQQYRKTSLEITTNTLVKFLAMNFLAGCYLFTVSNPGLLFSHGRPSQQLLSSFLTMSLAFKHDLDDVKENQHAKYLGQTSVKKLFSTHRLHIHMQTAALRGPPGSSVV